MPVPSGDGGFREEQTFAARQARAAVAVIPLLVSGVAVLRVAGSRLVARLPASGADLVFLAVLLWIVFAWLLRVRLVVQVHADGLLVRLRGLPWRDRVARGEWTRASVVTFDAVRDFGGYGLRRAGPLRAYVAGGTTGVKLALRDGSTLIVGSARPADLVAALEKLPPS
ncbi:MAG TPA: hypothetical protein VFA27_00775 [Vicinamibacterales bacterium]|nr:hypothetical protein [Vicinamibacterales bacterium]